MHFWKRLHTWISPHTHTHTLSLSHTHTDKLTHTLTHTPWTRSISLIGNLLKMWIWKPSSRPTEGRILQASSTDDSLRHSDDGMYLHENHCSGVLIKQRQHQPYSLRKKKATIKIFHTICLLVCVIISIQSLAENSDLFQCCVRLTQIQEKSEYWILW